MMIGTCERRADLAAHVDARDPGSITSSRTSAGRTASKRSSASTPSAAVSTRKPSRCRARPRSASRYDCSSSTTRISGGSAISALLDEVSGATAAVTIGIREPERRALALARLDGDVAAVRLGDVADDREPEPGAAGAAAAGLVDAVEALEDPLEVARRDPDAVVADLDRRPSRRRPRALHRDRLPGSEYLTALSSRFAIALTTWRRSHVERRVARRSTSQRDAGRGSGRGARGRPRRRRARRPATGSRIGAPAPR